MVSSENGESLFISDFKCKKQADGFGWVVSSVNIISQKEIVGVWYVSSYFEQFHEIIELAMDIATDKDGCSNVDNIGLFCEYLSACRWIYLALSHKTLISC